MKLGILEIGQRKSRNPHVEQTLFVRLNLVYSGMFIEVSVGMRRKRL